MEDQLRTRISRFLQRRSLVRSHEYAGDYAVATTVGLVRERNEDAVLIVKARYHHGAAERDFDLAVVCDGLGGMKQGAEAARIGLSAFTTKVIRTSRASPEDRAVLAIGEANSDVFKELRGGGGTTLSAVFNSRSSGAVICHVGDSRVYSIGKSQLRQLTHDDTIGAALNKKDSSSHEPRDTRLLQFVGMGDDLEVQVFRPNVADTVSYLLTSDGAHDMPHGVLQRVVQFSRQPSDLAGRLLHLSEILGGLDNASVATIPVSMELDVDRPAEGLDLTLLAPWGQLDVWIPQLSDERRMQPVDKAPQTSAVEKPVAAPEGGEAPDVRAASKKSQKAKRPKRNSRKKKAASDDELPLSESLEIEFPERSRE